MLAELDSEIERTSLYLSSLKERRNALIPVSRLPPEIITHVFRIVTLAVSFDELGPRWLSFSQVCRIWRALALG